MADSILQLSEEKVLKYLDWESIIKVVQHALANVQDTTQCIQTPRSIINVPNGVAMFTMPGYVKEANKQGALACKFLTVGSGTGSTRQPSHLAKIILFDDVTGALLAIMAASGITEWRTAAATVVATKPFIKDPPGILAIIGAGAQGRIHAIAFQHAFRFKQVRIWNRSPAKAEQLVGELRQTFPNVSFDVSATVEACLNNADVIVTTTAATKPIVKLEWVKNGAHINALGVGNRGVYELDLKIYEAGPVWVDYMQAAQTEMENVINHGITLRGEIGAIINGTATKPINPRLTIFQSLGMAIEDCAVARLVYDKYLSEKRSTN